MGKDIGSSMYVLKRTTHLLECILQYLFYKNSDNIKNCHMASAGIISKVIYLLVVGF